MLKEVARTDLAPSSTNPRKTFDQTKLEELSRSIAEKGVLEPLLVRPSPNGGPAKYEIVAGERRYRAATIAEVETVPCIVRELTDIEALEIQAVENLQRDDLHPLEEAGGYEALMKEAGYDVQKIAQRISKSDGYVYDRLKLLQLVPALRKVFLAGEIAVGHAILLARLSAEDQRRALGDRWNSGIFEADKGDYSLHLEDKVKRKARSIGELRTWIDANVRFDPDEVDLPNLFPETEKALQSAEEDELKVYKVTREHRVPDGAKAKGERTYGRDHWKRADGGPTPKGRWSSEMVPSKTCEHSAMGVVVAGPGRGQAFPVCVAKKKCEVHWGEWQKERAKAKKRGSETDWKRQQREQEERQKREQAERKRWQDATPQLLEALAKHVKATKVEDLIGAVVEDCEKGWGGRDKPELVDRGSTIGDGVRYSAFLVLARTVATFWRFDEAKALLKQLGIDAKAIVDEVSPTEKAEIRTAIEKALEENPDASTEELQALAQGLNADIGDLSRRQFNARYVLPVKRKRKKAGAKKTKKRARKKS